MTEDVEKNEGDYANEKPSFPWDPKPSFSPENGEVYAHPSGRQIRVKFPRDHKLNK